MSNRITQKIYFTGKYATQGGNCAAVPGSAYLADSPTVSYSYDSADISYGTGRFTCSSRASITATMPEVPPPEAFEPELDIIRSRTQELPPHLVRVLTQDRPIDFRAVKPTDPLQHDPTEPIRQVWFRVIERLPDDVIAHQAILAYASDYGMLPTALLPHDASYRDPRLLIASLDHSVWMHRAFRADEWLLYSIDSPSASGARGFVRGQVFTREGVLVASVAQEGLIRMREPKPVPNGMVTWVIRWVSTIRYPLFAIPYSLSSILYPLSSIRYHLFV